jgi:crotonobetainyl-CoA:carnitine CoA-transferase CaiB-like acyl-CoA transferase
MASALEGIRIIDFTEGTAGPYAGMLLAEQGADVIKVEPPAGDRARGTPAFHVLNRSKRGIVLDLARPADRARAQDLASTADVVLVDLLPEKAAQLGIDYARLAKRNPRLVYCSMPLYGSKGLLATLEPDDTLVAAVTGVLGLQWSYCESPVFLVVPIVAYATGVLAALAVAATLFDRTRSGNGDHIEVSGLGGAFALQTSAYLMPLGALDVIRLSARKGTPRGPWPTYRVYRASDGEWFFLGALTPVFWTKLAVALGLEEYLADPRFEGAPLAYPVREDAQELSDRIAEIFATKPRQHWLDFLRQADVPAGPVQTRDEYFRDPQVLYNRMRVEIDDPEVGSTVQMGVPLLLHEAPGGIRGPAPLLGQHNDEVRSRPWEDKPTRDRRMLGGLSAGRLEQDPSVNAGASGDESMPPPLRQRRIRLWRTGGGGEPPTNDEPDRPAPSSLHESMRFGRAPLDGITVLDLGTIYAGPYGAMLLSDLGANVIKIEPLDGDPWRAFAIGFLGVNRGKRGLALDLKREQGRGLFHDLVRKADVVIDNFRAGVPQRLKIDYETLRAMNPRIVCGSVTPFGPSGPMAGLPGFDPILQARSGLMRAQGGDGEEPVYHQIAVCDFITGLMTTYGVATALYFRERTGRGQQVETSLANNAMAAQVGEFIRYKGRPPDPSGGRDVSGVSTLYRVYRCSDGWLFLAARTSEQARALAQATGLDAQGGVTSLLQAPVQGKVTAALEAFFADKKRTEIALALTEKGIPCAPCLTIKDLFEDEHLKANDLWWEMEHPVYGPIRQTGRIVKWGRRSMRLERTSPLLGQHSREVLLEFGVDRSRIEKLIEKGIVVSYPPAD